MQDVWPKVSVDSGDYSSELFLAYIQMYVYFYIYIHTTLHSWLSSLGPGTGLCWCECPQGSSTSTCAIQTYPEYCQKAAPLPPWMRIWPLKPDCQIWSGSVWFTAHKDKHRDYGTAEYSGPGLHQDQCGTCSRALYSHSFLWDCGWHWLRLWSVNPQLFNAPLYEEVPLGDWEPCTSSIIQPTAPWMNCMGNGHNHSGLWWRTSIPGQNSLPQQKVSLWSYCSMPCGFFTYQLLLDLLYR